MQFAHTLATLRARGDGKPGLTGEIGPDWSQGRASYGGIVAAFGNEAMRQLVPADRPLRGLDVSFVGPVSAGAVELDAQVLRVGKTVTLAQSQLISQGQVAATFSGIYGAGRVSSLNLPAASPGEVPPPDAIATPPPPWKNGGPHFTQHFEVRWIEGNSRPFVGAPMSHSKAYIRHRDASDFSEAHLVCLLDCIWTPSLQMLSTVVPSSSLNWRLEFLRHDYSFAPDAWWRIDTQTNAAGEGYISHSSVVIDPGGLPAAFSHQLVVLFG